MGAGEVRLFRFASVPMKLVRAECGPDVVLRQGKQSVASSLVEATLETGQVVHPGSVEALYTTVRCHLSPADLTRHQVVEPRVLRTGATRYVCRVPHNDDQTDAATRPIPHTFISCRAHGADLCNGCTRHLIRHRAPLAHKTAQSSTGAIGHHPARAITRGQSD